MKNSSTRVAQALNLIAGQLEAASSLLKYAGDDLTELMATDQLALSGEIRAIVDNLQAQATTIAGTGAFFLRLAEDQLGADMDDETDAEPYVASAPG